jgi:hypothetical protein
MTVYFDSTTDALAVAADNCGTCGQSLYQSGCTARGCNGLGCEDCGLGCDLDFVSAAEGGRCATALAQEPEQDREARINAERAKFGLSPTD